MAYTQLSATSPAVIPATDEIVYDRFWITDVNIISVDPNDKSMAIATIVPAREENGTITLKPGDQGKQIQIDDIFGLAETNSELSGAIDGLIKAVAVIGRDQGIIV